MLFLASVVWMTNIKSVKADDNIAINFSSFTVNQIWNGLAYVSPQSGYVFAIVNITITNNGYDSFDTNPVYFSATANNVAYYYDIETFALNNWSTVNVLNGGSFSGALVFQIPSGSSISSMDYAMLDSATLQTYNIIWNGQASTTTSNSPTATPTPTTATPTSTPASTQAVSELSWSVIVPLLLSVFSAAVIVKLRKTANLNQ